MEFSLFSEDLLSQTEELRPLDKVAYVEGRQRCEEAVAAQTLALQVAAGVCGEQV
jgi:hypothetical protein